MQFLGFNILLRPNRNLYYSVMFPYTVIECVYMYPTINIFIRVNILIGFWKSKFK
jgi:hypothetical protein